VRNVGQTAGTPATDIGHACWSYDDPRPFDDYARAFLREGLVAGERVWYVAGSRFDATAEWLRSMGAGTGRADTVRVVSVTDAYFGDRAIDPLGQRDAWAAALRDALAEGFPGMRVVADVTDLVRTITPGFLAAEDVGDLVLAVSEAVANAYRHGRPEVRLRIWRGDDRIVVTVTDSGAGPKDPFAGLMPMGDGADGGLGLWLVHQTCSHVAMHRHPTASRSA
jgi:hypothetical protein